MAQTSLSPEEEQEFQRWIRSTPWYREFVKEFGEEPDLNTPLYDYRAAFKAGVQPIRDPYDNNRFHWPSVNPKTGRMLKSKDHPTAWKEEFIKRTGKNPDALGIDSPEEAQKFLRRTPVEQQSNGRPRRSAMLMRSELGATRKASLLG